MNEAYIVVEETRMKIRKRWETFTKEVAVVVADSPKEAADILGATFVDHDQHYYAKHGHDPGKFEITFFREKIDNTQGWIYSVALSRNGLQDVFERLESLMDKGTGGSELRLRHQFLVEFWNGENSPRKDTRFWLRHTLHITK